MAEYRRFVAYVYEYQKGKKGNNCGFIKVEAWEKLCRIEVHLRCPGLIAGTEYFVYGFIRKKGLLNGSRIGSGRTEEGRMDCILETQTMAVGNGKIPLRDMNGMTLILESGGFFGTEWDDQPIRPEDFREMREVEDQKEEILKTEKRVKEAEEISGYEEKKETEQESEIHTQSVQESEIADYPENAEPLKPSTSPVHKPDSSLPPQNKEADDLFDDGELTDCRKITPEELCRLGRQACVLRNNRFLQYGYHNFGHLLLCRNRCGQWFLAVPGSYDQQERFMANMFGFSYFKESKNISISKGKGGYWYRSVDAPNLNL